jgi:hypothetical protein
MVNEATLRVLGVELDELPRNVFSMYIPAFRGTFYNRLVDTVGKLVLLWDVVQRVRA